MCTNIGPPPTVYHYACKSVYVHMRVSVYVQTCILTKYPSFSSLFSSLLLLSPPHHFLSFSHSSSLYLSLLPLSLPPSLTSISLSLLHLSLSLPPTFSSSLTLSFSLTLSTFHLSVFSSTTCHLPLLNPPFFSLFVCDSYHLGVKWRSLWK